MFHVATTDTVIKKDLINLIAFIIGESVSQYLSSFCFGIAGARLVKRTRDLTYDSILKQDVNYHNRHTGAELLTKIEKSEEFESLIEGRFEFLSNIVYVLGGIVIIPFVSNWYLMITVCAACVLMYIVSIPYRKRINNLTNQYIELTGALGTTIDNGISSYHQALLSRTAFNKKSNMDNYMATSQAMYNTMFKNMLARVAFQTLVLLVTRAGVAVAIYQAASQILNKELNPDNLVSFYLYCDLIYSHMWSSLSWLQSYEETNVKIEMLTEMMQ